MKKVFIVLMTICCLTLCGCSKENENNNSNVVFDMVEYSSIEELNKAAGTNITSIENEEITNEKYALISSSIAQYTFTINDEEWCVRASQDVDNDISGYYYDSIDFKKDVNAFYYTDVVYLDRFFNNDVQYTIALNVEDKEISTSYFDDICGQLQTNITGVKSGYDNELVEEGDDVIYRLYLYNEDGTTTTMETIYSFENDKMVSILSKTIFETEQACKDYYDLMIENGYDESQITIDGTTITSLMNDNLEFYSDLTKEEFINQMKSSLS